MKKYGKIVLSIIISVFVLLILANFVVSLVLNNQKDKIAPEDAREYIDAFYCVLQLRELFEMNNINYEISEFKDTKDDYVKMLDNLEMHAVKSETLAKIIYINEQLNLTQYDKMIEDLDKYYISYKKLFTTFFVEDTDDSALKDAYAGYVNLSIPIHGILEHTSVDVDKYKILDGLKDYYDNNDDSDLNVAIIYEFYDADCIDKLDTSRYKDIFQECYNESLKAVSSESFKLNDYYYNTEYYLDVYKTVGINTTEYDEIVDKWKSEPLLIEELTPSALIELSDVMFLYATYADALYKGYGLVPFTGDYADAVVKTLDDYYKNIFETSFNDFVNSY